MRLEQVKARAEGDADDHGRDLAYTLNIMVRHGHTLSDCDEIRPDDHGDGKNFTCTFHAAQ